MGPFLGPFFKSINSKATKKRKNLNDVKSRPLSGPIFQINPFKGHQKTKNV